MVLDKNKCLFLVSLLNENNLFHQKISISSSCQTWIEKCMNIIEKCFFFQKVDECRNAMLHQTFSDRHPR